MRIGWRDRLLLEVACWCRARMTPRMHYFFDRYITEHYEEFWGKRGEEGPG